MYNIIKFDTLPSTNKYLKEHYNQYDEFTVITTDNQTNGKGRMARVWNSTKDDLTFSILLKPNIDSSYISQIPLIMGAAVCRMISKYTKSEIKWPNDIMVNNKKIAGILVEGITSTKVDAIVVGVGINVNSTNFPEDLIIKATSLKNELNKTIDKEKLLNKIIKEFIILYIEFLNGNEKYIDICIENNYLKNKKVYVNNELIEVLDISLNGNLLIKDSSNNIKELYYGEVTLNKVYEE